MSHDHDRYREWDAAYVLGALSSADRREYEEHLEHCDECSAAVAELSGLPGILARIDAADAAAIGGAAVPASEVATERLTAVASRIARSRTRRRWTVGLALAASVLVGAGLGSAAVGLSSAVSSASARAETLHPVAGSGLSAQLAATSTRWGTRLDWSCSYRARSGTAPTSGSYPVTDYVLVVTTRDGATETVATWSSSGADARDLSASTRLPLAQIQRIDIRIAGTSAPLAAVSI